MGLADALRSEQDRGIQKGPRCSVCALYLTLDAADASALDEAMLDKAVATSVIARALKSEGHQIGASTLGRHRNGECRGAV